MVAIVADPATDQGPLAGVFVSDQATGGAPLNPHQSTLLIPLKGRPRGPAAAAWARERDELRLRKLQDKDDGEEAGTAAEALRLFIELLPDQMRVLGSDHPDTLTTRNNIATWTGLTGQSDQAEGAPSRSEQGGRADCTDSTQAPPASADLTWCRQG